MRFIAIRDASVVAGLEPIVVVVCGGVVVTCNSIAACIVVVVVVVATLITMYAVCTHYITVPTHIAIPVVPLCIRT